MLYQKPPTISKQLSQLLFFLICAKQIHNHLKITLISITYSFFFSFFSSLLSPLSSTFSICFDHLDINPNFFFPTQLQFSGHGVFRCIETAKRDLSFVLLAASAQNKCTALVCSCYVPSRGYHNRGEENSNNNNNNNSKDVVKEEVDNNEARGCDSSSSSSNGGRKSTSSWSNGPHIEHSNLKSNLKKAVVEENHQLRTQRRKVSWPDAHGKDIAHVREFEPSVSEDGELQGVRNSCVCVIQ